MPLFFTEALFGCRFVDIRNHIKITAVVPEANSQVNLCPPSPSCFSSPGCVLAPKMLGTAGKPPSFGWKPKAVDEVPKLNGFAASLLPAQHESTSVPIQFKDVRVSLK